MTRLLTPLGVVVFVLLALFAGCASVFTWGSLRYDGPDGLLLRVRAEIAALRPHPQFVPTPLAALSGAGQSRPTEDGGGPNDATSLLSADPFGLSAAPSPTPGAVSASPALPDTAAKTDAEAVDTPPVFEEASAASIPQQPAATPTSAHREAQPSVALSDITHMWQKWNNCGPATLAMYISHFGDILDQAGVAEALKGNKDDKNVSPHEMAAYARAKGFEALVRVNGNDDRLRLFLSNGIPVLIETWLEEEPNNGMGHYRLVTGYDDAAREWIVFDSYVSKGVRTDRPYAGIRLSYEETDALWAVFNRTYLVIHTDETAALVHSILGEEADDTVMWQNALRRAQKELRQTPEDPFAWFNLGTALVAFERWDDAVAAYEQARIIGLPWRMLWYQFGPFEAYYQTGRYEELIALADATIRTAGNIEETYYWKGMALAAQGRTGAARDAFRRAIALNAHYDAPIQALAALNQPDRTGARTR